MEHAVIGVFDDSEQAEDAAQALAGMGFDDTSLHSADDAGGPSEADALPPAEAIEDGLGSSLLHRLAAFFDIHEPHLAHDEEGLRRGGTVVRVKVDSDARAAAAREALLALGAINIDDRLDEGQQTDGTGGGTARRGE